LLSYKNLLSSKSLKTKSIFLFLGKLSGFIVNFLIPIVLVRFISKSDFGYFQQFNLLFTSIVLISTLWINSSLYYFFPEKSKLEKSMYFKIVLSIKTIIWFLMLLGFILFKDNLLAYLEITNFDSFSSYIIITLFFLMMSSSLEVLFILDDKKLHNLLYFSFDRIAKAMLIFLLVISYSIKGIIISFLLYSMLRFLYTVFYTKNYLTEIFNKKLYKEKFIKLIKYSLPFGVGLMSQNFALRIDQFVLLNYVNASDFAIYSIAFYSIPLINYILSSINNIAMPELTKMAIANNKNLVLNLWNKIIKKNISITVPALGFFYFFANEIIIILFTDSYIESVKYYRIYIFSIILTSTSYGLVLRAANLTKKVMFANLVGLFVSTISAIYLIPTYAMEGAIITAMIAYLIPISIQIFFEIKYLESSFFKVIPSLSFIKNILITISALLLMTFVEEFFNNTLIKLIICFIIFSLIVTALQYISGIFIFQKELKKLIDKN